MSVKDINRIPELLNSLKEEKERILRLAGVYLEGKIKETIDKGRPEWPPLSPATIAKKGSSKPLYDTGKLINSITHEVENDVCKVGVFGERALIAAVHEFGTNRAGRGHKVTIPARPFIRPTFDEEQENIKELINAEIDKVIRRHTFHA